jgi:hypothetical protein
MDRWPLPNLVVTPGAYLTWPNCGMALPTLPIIARITARIGYRSQKFHRRMFPGGLCMLDFATGIDNINVHDDPAKTKP